jgi:hypothetical protein
MAESAVPAKRQVRYNAFFHGGNGMHESIQAHFKDLEDAVRTTKLPIERRDYIAGLIQRLPSLYSKYRETSESRFGDQITVLVQAVLKALDECPEAQELGTTFRVKLHLLHQKLGVPELPLKPPRPPAAAKKTRKKK